MQTKAPSLFNLPQRIIGLEDLAENLWWSWHPAARMLFKRLNRQSWKDTGHNPDKMLKELPGDILEAAARDPEYLRNYDIVMSQFKREIEQNEFHILEKENAINQKTIAYFSAEYGLHHSLPFYAGGLGFLAGDYLKECSDLNIPLVAIGFMYPEGYFKQRIRDDGWQESVDQVMDREAASISRVLGSDGNQMIIRVPLIEPPIHVALWKVMVGRIPLYLMDTDIEINDPWNRQISARLYIGDVEQRLRQEIVLGIGGSGVLEAMGIQPAVFHLNEGHTGFCLLEEIRTLIEKGMDFEKARDRVRATTVFTTHTPVSAGHDVFPLPLLEKYFRSYWSSLGIGHKRFLSLGTNPERPLEGFNMTVFALRMSAYRNAVSQKHGEVTRRMWQSLWPDIAEKKVPIDSITNGVHVPTWIEPKFELLFNKYLGPEWLRNYDEPVIWEMIENIPDKELWETHYWLKIKLIDAVREKARKRWALERSNFSMVLAGGTLLDPSVLTIGFARRFATYKRADLVFTDLDRLKKLLNDRWRPIQIIFAGKAHPADDPGKRVLQQVYNAAKDPEMGGRVAFLEDYGEQFAQYLVHGVDVWLNNPLPPLEASGTSGMKAALNGVPNLSIWDGWWVEGYNGKNGWTFGKEGIRGDRNCADAEAIYNTLEQHIIPIYYHFSDDGIPHDWVKIMRESIRSCAPKFSTRRMVKQYIEKFYKKAFEASV